MYVTTKICYEGFNHLLRRRRILEGRDLQVSKISRCSLTIFAQSPDEIWARRESECRTGPMALRTPRLCSRCHSCHIHVAHFWIIERRLVPGIVPRIKLTTFNASSCTLSSRNLSLCDLFHKDEVVYYLPIESLHHPFGRIYLHNPQLVGRPSTETW